MQTNESFAMLKRLQMQLVCKWRAVGVCVSLTLFLVLLGTTAYLYSGQHKHERYSTQPCAFHSFESSPVLQAAVAIQIPQPVENGWYVAESRPQAVAEVRCAAPIGRAPPRSV